jgi:hypothetical protein
VRRPPALLLAALAALLVAPAASQAVAAKGGKVVAAATGAGHVAWRGSFRRFAFTAREYANGDDRGQAQLRSRDAHGNRVHIRITCLNVVDDVAQMTGVVTKIATETAPLQVKRSRVAFSVRDNGRTGDLISLVTFFGPGAPLDCEAVLTSPTLAVERGQVKVRERP